MRKAISLMMVLVLGMAVMGTSAYAVCPDPDHITPWRYNGDPTPSGDDGGWDDVEYGPTAPGTLTGRCSGRTPVFCLMSYLIVEWVSDMTLDSNPTERAGVDDANRSN
jgi:hypothetical protein